MRPFPDVDGGKWQVTSGLDFPGRSVRPWTTGPADGRLLGLAFDVAASAGVPERRDLVTVLNWAEELKRLAPAN